MDPEFILFGGIVSLKLSFRGLLFAVESVLTTISEMEKEIESLHYREHKRIAIQGIISAIRYVSCGNTSQDASGVEPMQVWCLRINRIVLTML